MIGRLAPSVPWCCVLVWLAGWCAEGVAQESGVYRYRDREGRSVYTNLDGMASHGGELEALTLPPLSSIDFKRSAPEELRRLDTQVRETHSALQAGERCETIRKSSRVPLRKRIFAEHDHKLYVAGALLGFALLLGYLAPRRRLGSLLPVAPFLGCAFLGYVSFRQTQDSIRALTSGLRACSEQLPDGASDDAPAVKNRLSRALDIRRSIHAAYERQAHEIEAVMRER